MSHTHDNGHETAVNIPTADLGPRAKVKVMLVNVGESISYWVNQG